MKPDYIFEASWEVCNKVGGIYAVLSTRAKSMIKYVGENNVIFVGPDFRNAADNVYFEHTAELDGFTDYVRLRYGLNVKVGRWTVPGRPLAVLVDFIPLHDLKDEIYGFVWEKFGVDSLHGYGDYGDSSMFGWASGMVVKAYYDFAGLENQRVIAHFNEWMTAFGLFYIKSHEPKIATLFTTHATTVGRSIAGNGKPLYDYFSGYFGDQMACELNVESKHSAEKQAAHYADCFTTVSDITDDECAQLLEKRADVVTPNGFELDFVPKSRELTMLSKASRSKLVEVSERLLGYGLSDDVVLCAVSGRYEYKNKGIDLFIDALSRLNNNSEGREIVAFILVPGWQKGACDLTVAGIGKNRYVTHELVEPWNDPVTGALGFYGFDNSEKMRVKIIFVPAYLHGDDGIFNVPYYDLLAGFDFTVFPSYYEPWGYTPMESVAFGVPAVTTNLSGFGRWVNPDGQTLFDGVGVVLRGDSNFTDVSEHIAEQIEQYVAADKSVWNSAKKAARSIAKKAQWSHFFQYYRNAYDIALKRVFSADCKK